MRYLWPPLSLACLALTLFGSSPALAVSGAELIRNEPFRYGRFAARIQFAPGDGILSTFFLWKNGSELADVFWNEIDIEKLGANCMGYSSNALYGLPQSNHTQDITSTEDLCAGYHTHAIEWTPESLIWLLDGTEVRRLTGVDLQAFEDNALPGMQLRFNLWVGNASFGGNFSPDTLPVHQYINWVSYSEYTPAAGDDGTDFTLVFREEFDAPLSTASWSFATWASPFNLSVHSPSNITIAGGKAVLSLTADDALGFVGTPPADPADGETPVGVGGAPNGGTVGGTAGSSALPNVGSPASPTDSAGPLRTPSSGGCSLAPAPSEPLPGLGWLLASSASALLLGRRRGFWLCIARA